MSAAAVKPKASKSVYTGSITSSYGGLLSGSHGGRKGRKLSKVFACGGAFGRGGCRFLGCGEGRYWGGLDGSDNSKQELQNALLKNELKLLVFF